MLRQEGAGSSMHSYTVVQYKLLPFQLFDKLMFMTSSYMSPVTKGLTNFLHKEERRNLWLLKQAAPRPL